MEDQKKLTPVNECRHPNFRVNANVNATRVRDEGPAEVLTANVTIWCVECGHFFDFESGVPFSRGIMLNMVVPDTDLESEIPKPKIFQGDEPRIEQ